jgi:peptidoglycan/LPS O-acetylase OafA/YrhL
MDQTAVFVSGGNPWAVARAGSFDSLRLLAASVVLFSHCYPMLGIEGTSLVARALSGTYAVYAFFAISGYLVTLSWVRDPDVSRFMQRRSLRIFPALIFVIIASVFIIGPIATNLNLTDYFTRKTTWSFLAKIFIYPPQYNLPGVFEDNPFPNVINGSLWTLRLEFGLYVVVAVLGQCGMLRFRNLGAALTLLCLAVYVMASGMPANSVSEMILKFASNMVPFFVGMALAQNNPRSKVFWILTLGFMISSGLLLETKAFAPLLLISLPLAVLLIGTTINLPLGKMGDYSYGVYLWGFPVEQTLVHFLGPLALIQLFWRAAGVTLLIAMLSWHLVEERALQLKPRRKG